MPITNKIGIHSLIQLLYWRIRIACHSGQKEITIADTKAKFHITTKEEFRRFHNLVEESSIIKDLLHEVSSSDVVYDVGANVGIYTCFLACEVSPENLIAFEPHPSNIDALQKNLRLTSEDSTILEKALSDTAGTAELKVESQSAGEGEHSLATHAKANTIEVALETGDRLIGSGELPAPSVIKIDVEGAELRVLRGLRNALMSSECRLCYVEVHPDRISNYDGSAEEVERLLKSCGFSLCRLQDRDDEYFIKATK